MLPLPLSYIVHFGRIGEFVLDLFKVLNNLHFPSTFIVNELAIALEASWTMSSSRLMQTPTFTNKPPTLSKNMPQKIGYIWAPHGFGQPKFRHCVIM